MNGIGSLRLFYYTNSYTYLYMAMTFIILIGTIIVAIDNSTIISIAITLYQLHIIHRYRHSYYHRYLSMDVGTDIKSKFSPMGGA